MNIEINLCPKEYIRISYILNTISDYDPKSYWNTVYYDYKKWTLDYDMIMNSINELKDISKYNELKNEQFLNKTTYDNFFTAANNIKEYINSKKHCIWYIKSDYNVNYCYKCDFSFKIGIKQGNSNSHYDYIRIYDVLKYNGKSVECIEDELKNKLCCSMNEIKDYVMRYDGYLDHTGYRHMFVNKGDIING